jgi:hypothetical protein
VPGAELCFGTELAEVREGFEEGFLRSIFGVGSVAKDGKRSRVDGALVGLNQLIKEITFARFDAGNEVCFTLIGNGGGGSHAIGFGNLIQYNSECGAIVWYG